MKVKRRSKAIMTLSIFWSVGLNQTLTIIWLQESSRTRIAQTYFGLDQIVLEDVDLLCPINNKTLGVLLGYLKRF